VSWTNRGAYRLAKAFAHGSSLPSQVYIALVRASPAPSADTNTMADVTEITAGNGYSSGGVVLDRNVTDFDSVTEDDTGDEAPALIKDIAITASGGNIPPSGAGFRYIVLTDNNATIALREIYAYWDLGAVQTVLDTQTLTIQDLELDFTPA